MASVAYLLFFMVGGAFICRCQLPGLKPVLRAYIGASFGLLLMMWLPVGFAYFLSFTLTAHWLAAAALCCLCGLAWLFRDKQRPARFDDGEKKLLKAFCLTVLPLTVLGAYLQYTHSIRPAADGGYHVGQSTYGDLSLHLAVTTSIQNAKFPLQNSLMLGATMAYPYLADSVATSMYMLGMSLPTAMAFTGSVMMLLVFSGYLLLCRQLCRKRGAAYLAFFLLFFNGGLGFFYTLSGNVENGVVTTVWDNLRNVIEGFYQTPTNQPDPHNLRWVNILCDMLLPQRGLLGGWTMLMPCFNLLLPPLCAGEKRNAREMIVLGLFAGGMPLLHTHSFLALGLFSIGACLYDVFTAKERLPRFKPWLLYGCVAAALSLPQLITFTFVQATSSSHFLRFQFNWCNNRGGQGLVDPYFWFYLKNVGLPYLLILLALLRRGNSPEARQNRLLSSGAFLIYLVAECVLFQPNEYDNNKLFYVWFLLCLPMAADYAVEAFARLRPMPGARLLAGLFLVCCFLSASLTVCREWVSDYQAYSAQDLDTAAYVRENTPEHSVFLTGNQHLNPVSSLAGRTILCSSDSYLYYHGFDTSQRRLEVRAFYENPADNLELLRRYGVSYVYISPYERQASWFTLNESELERLFPLVYESADGQNRVFAVPKEMRE